MSIGVQYFVRVVMMSSCLISTTSSSSSSTVDGLMCFLFFFLGFLGCPDKPSAYDLMVPASFPAWIRSDFLVGCSLVLLGYR